MKLSEQTIEILTGNSQLINRIAIALKRNARTVERSVAANKENGPLTTVAALQVIIKETGLTKSQILTK